MLSREELQVQYLYTEAGRGYEFALPDFPTDVTFTNPNTGAFKV